MMLNSSADLLGLVAEIYTRRTPMVVKKVKRATGGAPVLMPQGALNGLKDAKRMHERYSRGDFRHHEHEVGNLEYLGMWLIDVAQRMSGNPVRPWRIDRAAMVATFELPKDAYQQCLHGVRNEW
jgi:hypothetical protein